MFHKTQIMQYAYNEQTEKKYSVLWEKLLQYLEKVKISCDISTGKTIYIPDLHGDFAHLIITLKRHNLLENNLDLKKQQTYVFLGDFYDRAPHSDLIDFWLNKQIERDTSICRLIGNHEMAFFERDEDGLPLIFPSQDSIRDITNNFRITENLLKNMADGKILASYVNQDIDAGKAPTIYVHSYITNDDFHELGLKPDAAILTFAKALNQRLQEHSKKAYAIFLEGKKSNHINWKKIMETFHKDPLFDIYKLKNDISTSFIWRRTGAPMLRTFPAQLDANIPENVFQIVGHTPVFLFRLPGSQSVHEPFVLTATNKSGSIQFSDVGIGYYYREDTLDRPEVKI